jgi:hypothetical protein
MIRIKDVLDADKTKFCDFLFFWIDIFNWTAFYIYSLVYNLPSQLYILSSVNI